MKKRHNDDQKRNVAVTLFQHVLQTYGKKCNPQMKIQDTK